MYINRCSSNEKGTRSLKMASLILMGQFYACTPDCIFGLNIAFYLNNGNSPNTYKYHLALRRNARYGP